MPWLGAVLRKLSQTRCLTWSTPSHQTGRNLSRLQFKNWTTEQFPSDFWKLSLQHSPVPSGSQSTNRASCSHHKHIQPAPLLPCSPAFIRGSWRGAPAIPRGRTGAAPGQGSAELPELGQPLVSPQTLTFLWSRRHEECYSNPSVRAQTRNHFFPCSSTNQAPV